LGRFIAQERNVRGLTQGDVAKAIGVSSSAVSGWEAGKTTPDKLNYEQLVIFFGPQFGPGPEARNPRHNDKTDKFPVDMSDLISEPEEDLTSEHEEEPISEPEQVVVPGLLQPIDWKEPKPESFHTIDGTLHLGPGPEPKDAAPKSERRSLTIEECVDALNGMGFDVIISRKSKLS
jgi:transcriptional regulator with XRE-family HTH domain